MRYAWIIVVMWCSLPSVAAAAIIINEVAWMGDTESANNEWIELYNTGAAEDIAGWTLSDGMNLNISLSGVIDVNQYAVLERTDDESAPGAAFLIYTGGLVNGGATLVLRRADGSIVDQVAGGANWENIGGDNVTKETAQFTTSGWVTETATPGAGVTITSESTVVEDVTIDTPSTGATTVAKTGTSAPKDDGALRLTVNAPTVAYVGQAVAFTTSASGGTKMSRGGMDYAWNFGDLSTTSTKRPMHRFMYPGTYLVQVEGVYRSASVRTEHQITVLPVTLSITRNPFGDIQLHNDAKYPMAIGGYTVVGNETVSIPPDTTLLAGATLTIPKAELAVARSEIVRVFNDAGDYVLSQQPLGAQPQVAGVAFSVPEPVSAITPVTLTPEVVDRTTPESFLEGPSRAATAAESPAPAVTSPGYPAWIWYVVLGGVGGLTVVGLVYLRWWQRRLYLGV